MNERPPLPIWMVTEDGRLLNLAHVVQIRLSDPDEWLHVGLLAETADDILPLGKASSEEQAQEALRRLTHLLPIAVVDVDLDVSAPLQTEGGA